MGKSQEREMVGRVISGDAKKMLAELPANSIDAIITDPP